MQKNNCTPPFPLFNPRFLPVSSVPLSSMAASTTTTSAAADCNSDEWELVNDDGFVYKRKKRRVDLASLARAPDPDPDPDPAVEVKERRKKKRKALFMLKEKYQREISLWEHLSNTLQAMEEGVKWKHEEVMQTDGEQREGGKKKEMGNEGSEFVVSMENRSGSWVDELLLQLEAQEAIMRDLSHLCEVAESLCNAQEEKAKLSFLNLPIWSSPGELVASLCED